MTIKTERQFSPFPTRLRLANARFQESFKDVKELRAAIRGEIADRPGLVLEVGCGFGFNSKLRSGDYLGVDPDDRVIEKARKLHPDRRFEVMNGCALELPDASAECVLMALAVHEVAATQRERMLSEACRVTRDDVVIADFNADLRGLRGLIIRAGEHRHFGDYLSFDLGGFMERKGFAAKKCARINRTFRLCVFEKGLRPEDLISDSY